MNQNLKRRIEKLEDRRGLQETGALVESLPDGRYLWAGHDGTFTMEEIQARLKPGAMIVIFDLPRRKARTNHEEPTQEA